MYLDLLNTNAQLEKLWHAPVLSKLRKKLGGPKNRQELQFYFKESRYIYTFQTWINIDEAS